MSAFRLMLCAALIAVASAVAAQDAVPSPDAVATVQAYYESYIEYTQPDPATFRNPIITGYYREGNALTPSLIARIDDMIASPTGLGYDPILCAQDLPRRVEALPVDEGQDTASVLVNTYFGDNPDPASVTVGLVLLDGAWRIDTVTCGETVTPAGVVQTFYDWYLAYSRPDADGNAANPLVDRAHRDNVYLAPALVAAVDAEIEAGLLADPLLCAQDRPHGIVAHEVHADEATARVVVHQFFTGNPNPREIAADLAWTDGGWRITAVACDITAADMALDYYNWYLMYRRYGLDEGIAWTPIVDWRYWPHEVLSADLLARLTDAFTGDEPLAADPVLGAQDLPERLTAETLESTAKSAVVRLSGAYPAGAGSYSSYPLVDVTLERVDGRWNLTDIAPAR